MKCDNYIACDAATKSEIVVPCFDKLGIFKTVLDIDSPKFSQFDNID